MYVLALVGISGVGKSTLLRVLAKDELYCHLQASDLIKAEMSRVKNGQPSSEELRRGNVLDNQELLVTSFKRAKIGVRVPIIFDGHTVIDGPNGNIDIPSYIFKQIGISKIFFLHDKPEKIAERRGLDKRTRPNRSAAELGQLQDRSICVGARIARDLGISMTLITPENIGLLHAAITEGAIT